MTMGLQISNADGVVFFDTDTITWNFLGSFTASSSGATSANFPAISTVSETLVQLSFIDEAPGNQEAYNHNVSISGTTVTASGGNSKTLVVVLGR